MVRGLYSSAHGMMSQFRKINVLGSNVSNIDTSGYKQDDVSFRSYETQALYRMKDGVEIGSITAGVEVGGVTADFTQGDITETGRATDLAIRGDGFFAVQDTQGNIRYTRDGSFSVDAGGYLALASGERLLGSDGNPLYVGGTGFSVSEKGAVAAKDGTALGTITLYKSLANGGTIKRDGGFYDLTDPQAAGGNIMQGHLESSNVSAVDGMSGLMEAQRSFQSCQQAFQTSLDTLDRLISQVGSLKA